MNFINSILDLVKAFLLGIKEGFHDLINWNREPRELPAERSDTSWKKYFVYPEWRSWLVMESVAQITVVLVLLIIIRQGVMEFRFIPSESMMPTMKIGDRLMVEKLSKIFRKEYQRGDIVIFYPPVKANGGKEVLKYDPFSIFARLTGLPFLPQPEAYIKRIIGVPGDRVRIRANQGVFINGKHLEEPYHHGSIEFLPEYDMKTTKVPKDHYLVLGDNRNYSHDSHVWGLLPKSRVIGRAAFLIYRPLDEKPEIIPAIIDPELTP